MSEAKCPLCGGDLIQSEEFPCFYSCQSTNWKSDTDKLCELDDCAASVPVWETLRRTRKALNHCIKIFHQLEDVLDEKASLRDFDDPDLYAWAVQIKPIWLELKEITGTDYKTALEQKDIK